MKARYLSTRFVAAFCSGFFYEPLEPERDDEFPPLPILFLEARYTAPCLTRNPPISSSVNRGCNA